jgi:hypothetical protein
MTQPEQSRTRLRARWSAIGAAVAVTLGAGGIGLAQASLAPVDQPVTVTVDAQRILDTRINLGLAGGFAKDTPREVQVTGAVDVATDTGTTTETVVPAGATAVLVNVTVVLPTDQGFLTLRAGGAAGAPSTSTVNFAAGSVEPNAATVDLSNDGKIQVWVFMPDAAARADVLIDVVGYTVDHNHDDRYYTQAQVDAEIEAAIEAAPGATGYEVVTSSFDIGAGTFGIGLASCPSGKLAVGGGFNLSPNSALSGTITITQATVLGNAYQVDVHNSGGTDQTGVATVVCLAQ